MIALLFGFALANPIPQADSPKSHAEQWVVIIASSKEMGQIPSSWDTVQRHPKLALNPVRLNSGHFKNFMPCSEFVVVKRGGDMREMQRLGRQLKRLGIPNEVKYAGAYVGPDARVARLCSHSDQETAASFLSLAVSANGHIHQPLRLDKTLVERVLDVQPILKPINEQGEVWFGDLPHKTLAGNTVGDYRVVLSLIDEAETLTCRITGFSLMVRGTPHFSNTGLKSPKCGEPEVVATLDCKAKGLEDVFLISHLPEQNLQVHLPEGGRMVKSPYGDATEGMLLGQRANVEAQRRNSPLISEHRLFPLSFRDQPPSAHLVESKWYTNNGEKSCGKDDVVHQRTGLYVKGIQIGPLFDTYSSSIRAVVNPDQEEPYFILSDWAGGWSIQDKDGQLLFDMPRGFCNNPC